MSRETAVELLVDAIRGHIAEGTLDAITISRAKMIAKAMEREQIEQAYIQAMFALAVGMADPEKYYDETYKGGLDESKG